MAIKKRTARLLLSASLVLLAVLAQTADGAEEASQRKAITVGKLHLGLALPTGEEEAEPQGAYEFEYTDEEEDASMPNMFGPTTPISIESDYYDDVTRPASMAEIISLPLLPPAPWEPAQQQQQQQQEMQMQQQEMQMQQQQQQQRSNLVLLSRLPVGLALQQSIAQPAAALAADVARSMWQAMQQLEQQAAGTMHRHNPFRAAELEVVVEQDDSSTSGSQEPELRLQPGAPAPAQRSDDDGGLEVSVTVESSHFDGLLPMLLRGTREREAAAARNSRSAAAVAQAVLQATLGELRQARTGEAASQQQRVAAIVSAMQEQQDALASSGGDDDDLADGATAAAVAAATTAAKHIRNKMLGGVELEVQVTDSRRVSWSRVLLIACGVIVMQLPVCLLMVVLFAPHYWHSLWHGCSSEGDEEEYSDDGDDVEAAHKLDSLVDQGLYKKLLSYT